MAAFPDEKKVEDDMVIVEDQTDEERHSQLAVGLSEDLKNFSKLNPTVEATEAEFPSQLVDAQRDQYSTMNTILIFLRSITVDVPLALVFMLFLLACFVQHAHDRYYVTLFNRSMRTDNHLLDEYTYYERQCNAYDISTNDLQDLVVRDQSKSGLSEAVDKMMTHGTVVIPKLFSEDIVTALRAHVVKRNGAVDEQEAFPVSQGNLGLRVSYGIDASEDESVARAVSAAVQHPLLRPLLQTLTGDEDPASAEITAITSFAGASDQVWHADTKGDGNALKFARTYTHSYSLFVPLQDTTERMGATDICPGTQYCANDLTETCQQNRVGLHMANPTRRVIEAGDGALLNQHMWHRGSGHDDPNAPERVVFILSFLARPPTNRVDTGDARQLSRGTYFHQRWNMWGHTMKDLENPMKYMKYPLSVFRSMSLLKPFQANWGYDLVTSAFMRFSNEQLEDEELQVRLMARLDEIGFPAFLRGRILSRTSQKKSWETFVRETIQKTVSFLGKVNVLAHLVYGIFLAILDAASGKRKGFGRSISRTLFFHFLCGLVAVSLVARLKFSRWVKDVHSGRTLMRPFPPVIPQRRSMYAPTGATTFPTRLDVLIGTRFDAPFLGTYDLWLDYHPGNKRLQQTVSRYADMYSNASPELAERVEIEISDVVESGGGRFLQQDHRTGDWRILSKQEIQSYLRVLTRSHGNPCLAVVWKRLKWMVADSRFGVLRGTSISSNGTMRLNALLQKLAKDERRIKRRPTKTTRTPAKMVATLNVPSMEPIGRSPIVTRGKFSIGDLVWCKEGGDDWFPGSVVSKSPEGITFTVAYDDGFEEKHVNEERLRPFKPITEGDRVKGCFRDGLTDCYDGTVHRVHASGRATIFFDDGDVEWMFSPEQYFIPPFRYTWEFY